MDKRGIGLIGILFISIYLPFCSAETILPRRYYPNLPMQRSIFHKKGILWNFVIDSSSSELILQNRSGLKCCTEIGRYILGSCSDPYNFDVFVRGNRFHVIHYPGGNKNPLIYSQIEIVGEAINMNISFKYIDSKEIISSQKNTSYTHPSIAMDHENTVFISFFNTNDGHLYLAKYSNNKAELMQISNIPAINYYSRVILLPYEDIMVLFSNENLLNYIIYRYSSGLSNAETLIDTLSSPLSWSAVCSYIAKYNDWGRVVIYHTNIGNMTLQRYSLINDAWVSNRTIRVISGKVLPMIASLANWWEFSIVWHDSDIGRFYRIVGNEESEKFIPRSIIRDIPAPKTYLSIYGHEYTEHVGLVYPSRNGLQFHYFGSEPGRTPQTKVVGGDGGRPSYVGRAITGFIILLFLFGLAKILFGVSSSEMT